MIRAAALTTAGAAMLLAGLYLAAALIWSTAAGVAVVLVTAGAAALWAGLTFDLTSEE